MGSGVGLLRCFLVFLDTTMTMSVVTIRIVEMNATGVVIAVAKVSWTLEGSFFTSLPA